MRLICEGTRLIFGPVNDMENDSRHHTSQPKILDTHRAPGRHRIDAVVQLE